LNSFVLIFREDKDFNQSESWKESFKLLSIQNESAIVELSNESTKFRFISLKFYYQNDDHVNNELSISSIESSIKSSIESISDHTDSIVFIDRLNVIAVDSENSLRRSLMSSSISILIHHSPRSDRKKLSIYSKKRSSYQSIRGTYHQMFEFLALALWMKLSIQTLKKRSRNSD
jgi:hypothetical protein